MSVLFDPYRIGPLEVKNRFVRSATFEGRADGQGGVTSDTLSFYDRLAQGELGTIITGIMYVRQDGKGSPLSLGIDRDDLLPATARTCDDNQERRQPGDLPTAPRGRPGVQAGDRRAAPQRLGRPPGAD